jgi:flagellar basal body P-ring formation protein FlgA
MRSPKLIHRSAGRRQSMLIAAAAILLGLCNARAFAADSVTITLKERATVVTGQVCLGSIADIKASSPALRVRLSKLDLATLEDSEEIVVTARQVLARLVIDGVPSRQISLKGADETHVSRSKAVAQSPAAEVDPAKDAAVLEQIGIQLSMSWLVPIEDIEVRLVTAASGTSQPAPPNAVPEIELPDSPDPGRISVRVRWVDGDKIVRIDLQTVEVRLRQTVLLAAASIPRGGILDPKLLIEDRRLLMSRVTPISLEETVGQPLRKALSPGEIVSAKDIAGGGAAAAHIKARDVVRVTARKGSLKITMQAAEALQSGRVGDLIRVRNTQSNRIITGKIVSPRDVEITLD